MGIKNLFQIISENAPEAIKTGEIKNQFGRKVAIDAYDLPHTHMDSLG
jgi:flap endonuclease-1